MAKRCNVFGETIFLNRPLRWGSHSGDLASTLQSRRGQFDLLLKAEQAQAEVYYVAPRFTTWDAYVSEFQSEHVLCKSLLFRPSEIEEKLAGQDVADGRHRIVYDQSTVIVCSEPIPLNEQNAGDVARTTREKIDGRRERADAVMKEIQAGLDHIREIRRPPRAHDEVPDSVSYFPMAAEFSASRDKIVAGRGQRLEALRGRAVTEADAMLLPSDWRCGR